MTRKTPQNRKAGRMHTAKKLTIAAFSLFFIGIASTASLLAQPEVTILFSPEDNCAQQIVSVIDGAQSSIDMAMYSFTSRPIAQALVEAFDRGVKVRVYLEQTQQRDTYSKGGFLEKKGLPLKYKSGVGLMHHKFAVVDETVVLTGSYNWTASADLKNDENLLVINSRPIAKAYSDYFSRLWEGSVPEESFYIDPSRLEKRLIFSGKEASKGYVGSNSSMKLHRLECPWAKKIAEKNKAKFSSKEEGLSQGYIPCNVCRP